MGMKGMKWKFKEENDFEARKLEGGNIKKRYPDRIPVSF